MLTIDYHGVDLSPQDFPRDLRGQVAFYIAMAFNTRCKNKEAALELLLNEADGIISTVMTHYVDDADAPVHRMIRNCATIDVPDRPLAWQKVEHIFGIDETSSVQLCQLHGIDPYATCDEANGG